MPELKPSFSIDVFPNAIGASWWLNLELIGGTGICYKISHSNQLTIGSPSDTICIGSKVIHQVESLSLPRYLGLPYWQHQLVLSWLLDQLVSHQLSFNKVSHSQRDRHIDRTPAHSGPIKILTKKGGNLDMSQASFWLGHLSLGEIWGWRKKISLKSSKRASKRGGSLKQPPPPACC